MASLRSECWENSKLKRFVTYSTIDVSWTAENNMHHYLCYYVHYMYIWSVIRCTWAGRLTTKPSASAVNGLARTRKPRNPTCGRLSELVLISTCFTSISGVFTLNLFLRQVRRFYSFLVLIINEKISRCSYVRFLHVWHWRLVVDQGKISLSNCHGLPV